MRKLITAIVLFLISVPSFGQEKRNVFTKVWDYYFKDTTESAKPKFIVYPALAFTPETSWEIGLGGLLVFNAKKDLSNRLSEISVFTFITLESQYGLWLDHAIYSDQNNYYFLGRLRLQQFPLSYHGIGVETPEEPVARIDGFSFAWRERILRRIRNNLYAGLELDLNSLSSIEVLQPTDAFIAPPGINGYTNVGFGLGVVYDERYNVLNARKALFVEAGFLRYDQNLGSDFSYYNYFFDFRYYRPTFTNQVLAYQFFINANSTYNGSEVPFNQLALMGGENLMRGYYLGRYRDNTLMATQVEYRFLPFPFSKKFGGVLFGSLGAVSPSMADLNLDQVRFAGGAGIRYLIFPNKDVFIRFDVAATQEGFGYYFYIGEAF